MFLNVCLHSHSFPHHADWRKRRRRAGGILEVEFKFQRRSCKLSYLFLPCRQSTPETLLAGYPARGRSFGRFFSKRNHCELISTTVVICVNPFTPTSDQYQFSPYNFNTFLREKVQRIYKIITKEEMLLFFIKFSSPSGSLKNNIEFSHFGPFSVALSFLNHY